MGPHSGRSQAVHRAHAVPSDHSNGRHPLARLALVMDRIKRVVALGFGLLLLWSVIASRAAWLFLLLWAASVLLALAGLRYLAARERESFGQWQDYTVVGLCGTAVGALVWHLIAGAPVLPALLSSLAPALEGGGAFGAIAFAFHSRRPSQAPGQTAPPAPRSEEHTSELQSPVHLVCRLLLEKKKKTQIRLLLRRKTNPHKRKPAD